MSPREQAYIFLCMLVMGVLLGVVYDLLGVVRRGIGCGAADLLFGILCAGGMIAAGLALRCEVFRAYTLTAVTCGLSLYGMTIGTISRRIAANVRKMKKKAPKYAESA